MFKFIKPKNTLNELNIMSVVRNFCIFHYSNKKPMCNETDK